MFSHFVKKMISSLIIAMMNSRSHLVGGKDNLLPPSLWRDSWIAMRSVMKVRTFQVIVLQGIVGSIPWTALVFFTMWFELIGTQSSI